MVWLPTYVTSSFALGTQFAAWLTLAYVMINIVGNTLGGRLIHRGVPRGKIIAGAFVVTSIMFLGVFHEAFAPSVRYLLVLAYSAATGVVAAAALSGSARYARGPSEIGTVQGLVVQLSQVGVFISPVAIAWAVTIGGSWRAALWRSWQPERLVLSQASRSCDLNVASITYSCGMKTFRFDVTVHWGDTDPAKIVFYPNYFVWVRSSDARLF